MRKLKPKNNPANKCCYFCKRPMKRYQPQWETYGVTTDSKKLVFCDPCLYKNFTLAPGQFGA